MVRACLKCGQEFETNGRRAKTCPDCRTPLYAPHPKAPKSPPPPVGVWDNGLPQNDFRYYSEELHRAGSTYSLYCEGGPMSQYCQRTGLDTAWGHRTKKLSTQQASDWARSRGLTIQL